MTQVQHGLRFDDDEVDHEDLKVELPRLKTFKNQKNLEACLKFLGIKDTQMFDHMDPGFEKALELKTWQKLK
jgi:LmbE family N-acetylglucosaminyl deacetylase